MNYITEKYVKEAPETIKEIPVLQFAFHSDGTRKDIIQLIQDRENLIGNNRSIDIQQVDDLYRTIANYRSITKEETLNIWDYIEKTGTNDEFVFDLLQFRLEKSNLTEEQISKVMGDMRTAATKTMEQKGEQELEHEHEESIKDEVGDEFQPETENKKQEEQQVETMWMNRFQSWDRNSINLPNMAKRKEEAVRLMQNIEKQRDQQEKQEEQGEQDDSTNR